MTLVDPHLTVRQWADEMRPIDYLNPPKFSSGTEMHPRLHSRSQRCITPVATPPGLNFTSPLEGTCSIGKSRTCCVSAL